jgi:dihydroneopterin aldolase
MHASRIAPLATALQEINVDDIRVAADIGIHAHELGRRQTLIVAVRLEITSFDSDDIADTIDYNAVVRHAVALGERHIALVETFARRLAERCLDHPTVLCADVRITKPAALTNGVASTRIVLRSAPPSKDSGAVAIDRKNDQ